MSTRLHSSLIVCVITAPLLLASLGGCAPGGSAASVSSTPSAPAMTPAPPATITPVGAPTLPSLPTTTVAADACGKYFPSNIALTSAGGLVVSQTSGRGNLAYPEAQISSGQPAVPMPAPTLIAPENYVASAMPVVNPRLSEGGGGYVLAICNPSRQAHVISAVQVSLAAIKPFTDQLGAWQPCDGAYHPGSTVVGGGCGGADFENEYLHAAFAADAPVGATVTATQTGTNGSDASNEVNLGPLPVTLKPGQAMTIEVGVTQPGAPGYYTYAFALTVDGASTGVVAHSQMTLLAPVARKWDGAACQTSAMQAQIAQMPTPTANGGFICPAS